MAWRSGQSYSADLRERVLAAVDGGMGAYAAAPLFRVSVSYIYKALGRRRRTGEASARPRPGRPGRKLAALDGALRARVAAEPEATLAELRGWLSAEHGVSVSAGCLWAALDRLELTHKKTRSAKPAGVVRSEGGVRRPLEARDGQGIGATTSGTGAGPRPGTADLPGLRRPHAAALREPPHAGDTVGRGAPALADPPLRGAGLRSFPCPLPA